MKKKQKLIYVASPLRGDIEGNIKKAYNYCRWAAMQGVVPVASHILFTGFLNDEILEEREMGIRLGIDLLRYCDAIWVFGDVITEGMKNELDWARILNKPVRYVPEKSVQL